MNNAELVVLRTFSNEIDANIACGHLETEGIEALVKSDTVHGLWPDIQHFQDVRLIVPSDVRDRADEVLKAMGM